MSKKKKKTERQGQWGNAAFFALCVLFGALCGFFLPQVMEGYLGKAETIGELAGALALFLILFYAASFLQIAIHESGHLIFGLISGYRFSSFRLGSVMLLKENGRLHLRRFSLKGTAGQCLMAPPEEYSPDIPEIAYNLGGSLLNLGVSLVFALLLLLFHPQGITGMICLTMAAAGTLFALTNGIPLRLPSLNNDGKNALEIYKSPAAHKAFWVQLKCVEKTAAGMRVKEMPEEWFEMPSPDNMHYSLCAHTASLAFSRAMDEMDFPRAREIGREIMAASEYLPGLQKQLLTAEMLYCEAVGLCREEVIREWNTPKLKKTLKALSSLPSAHRVGYACDLLVEGDEKAANEKLKAFRKAAGRYPYPSELEGEEELLAYAAKVYEDRKQ